MDHAWKVPEHLAFGSYLFAGCATNELPYSANQSLLGQNSFVMKVEMRYYYTLKIPGIRSGKAKGKQEQPEQPENNRAT